MRWSVTGPASRMQGVRHPIRQPGLVGDKAILSASMSSGMPPNSAVVRSRSPVSGSMASDIVPGADYSGICMATAKLAPPRIPVSMPSPAASLHEKARPSAPLTGIRSSQPPLSSAARGVS